MDISSALLFLKGLIASSLIVLHLMLASASGLITSLSSQLSSLPSPSSSISTSTSAGTSTATSKPVSIATTTSATSTNKVAAKKPVPVKTATSTQTVVQTPKTPLLSGEQVNENTRASIVNILCVSTSGGVVRSISGSGVIIDARGVILTNAHIGQYFLLHDYPTQNATNCTIRTGSPASPMYKASLIYLPPAWIAENASQITAEHGVGTGENDYAFLRITSTTNPNGTLPSIFSNIGMTTGIDTGDSVLVAGYPAGFLDAQTIERNLYATSAFTTIGQLYTFNDPTHIDVVSLGGTVVSQGGSSGGAVVRTYDGKLSGLIATATSGTTTADRDLRAITVGYIERSLKEAGKGGLVEFLSQSLDAIETAFAPTFESEKQQLIKVIAH